MSNQDPVTVSADDLPEGGVVRAGQWTVLRPVGGEPAALSSRCRHQFADLSKGTLDASGCLVCPWHGSRYDVRDGSMVEGPKGFLGYVGTTPGYTQLVKGLGRVWRLRRRPVTRRGEAFEVG